LEEGENCILFPPENPKELVEQIERLIKDGTLYSKLSDLFNQGFNIETAL